MIYFIVALKEEAKPLIEYYKLKKDLNYHKFEVFSNNNYLLIITKVGILNCIFALSNFFSNKIINDEDLCINVGIMGSSKYKIKDKVLINKIESDYYDNIFYPDILFKHNYYTDSIISCNKVIKNLNGNYDMESFGIFYVLRKYFNCDRMIYFKIVSDNLNNVDINIKQLINSIIDDLNYLIEVNRINNHNMNNELFLDVSRKLNLTVSMKYILWNDIRYLFLCNIDVDNILKKYLIEVNNSEERKYYYDKLRKEIQKYIY